MVRVVSIIPIIQVLVIVLTEIDGHRLKQSSAAEHKHVYLSCVKGQIKTKDAKYGLGSRWITVTKVVASYCDHRTSCYVKASNNLAGDPYWGKTKYLHVKYNCFRKGKWGIKKAVGKEHKFSAMLRCTGKKYKIKVLKARYGHGHRYKDGSNAVRARCNGLHVCKVPAENFLFGDPAFGIGKTLLVEYKCSKH